MIISFTGYKRSGKSESAKFLEKFGFERINFKDSLIDEIRQNFPDLLKVIGDDFENKPPAVRTLLQNYGTEVRRRDNPNYWTDKWISKVRDKENVVVDDCRFLNEAEAIKNLGGIIIRIIRPGFTGDSHQSETEQNNISVEHTIIADSKKSLIQQVSEIYEQERTVDIQRKNNIA